MCFLRQLWWTPCSADPVKIGQDVLKSGSLIWRLQFNSTPLTIRHWHIFQNAPCLSTPHPPPPPKKKLCISIVFSFSYDGCNTKEKWRKEKENVTVCCPVSGRYQYPDNWNKNSIFEAPFSVLSSDTAYLTILWKKETVGLIESVSKKCTNL